MSEVAVSRCASYEEEEVGHAVAEALGRLGGLGRFVKQGQKVLLKPNLLSAKPPEACVTTHPAVLEAVARETLRIGAKPIIGDSPPYQGHMPGGYERLCQVTGVRGVAERLGIEVVSMDRPWREVETGGQRFKRLPVASAFLDADVVINLPKLKTHGLTAFTGSLKNMFGCVPGLKKSQFHLQARRDREVFAQALVDVFAACRPALSVMDAITAMDGEGPAHGDLKPVRLILASADSVALDAAACEIVGAAPSSVIHLRLAAEQGLGEIRPEHIELIGEELDELRVEGFRIPSAAGPSPSGGIRAPILGLLRRQFVAMPRVDERLCVACGACVEVCAAGAMELVEKAGGKPGTVARPNLETCIACYCCDEACPYGAIKLRRGWLGQLFWRVHR